MTTATSPYLEQPLRPLRLACACAWRERGAEPPCQGCVLADRCAWELDCVDAEAQAAAD